MKKLTEISARLEAISVEVEALGQLAKDDADESGDILAQIEDLDVEFKSLQEQKTRAEELQARVDAITAARSIPAEPSALIQPEPEVTQVDTIPAIVKAQKSKHFASSEDAFISGMYLAALSGNKRAGEILADQSVGTDDKGGFSVPTPLAATLVNLLESYGVARQHSRRIVMSAMTWDVPKLTEHATVYYPAEAAAITASDMTFAQINLVAKKMAALVKMSTEIVEDSVISMMDTAVESIAYQMAIAEDNNLFNGVASAINANGIAGDTSVADVDVTSVAALALTDFSAAAAALGNPIIGARNEWYINSSLYHGPVRDLLDAAGGNTIREFEGAQRPTLHGYPVNFVNVMPGADATTAGDLLAVFGDLSIGVYFGDRRQLGFKVLDQLYAENDQVGVIATQRIDIQVANPEVLSKITITG